MCTVASTRQVIGFRIIPVSLLLKMLFEICYVLHISPTYSYMGMITSLNHHKLIESYLITLAMLLPMSWRARTPSVMILVAGMWTGVIPLLSIYALQDRPAMFAYMSALSFFLAIVITSLPPVKLLYIRITPELFLGICITFVGAVVSLMIVQGAYRNFTFDLYAVYEYRDELSELVFIGPFVYLADWAPGVFNIALLIWALYYKNKILAVVVSAFQVFMYGCTLMKAMLFNFPAVAVTFYVIRRKGDITPIGWLICVIIAIGMLETVIFQQMNITGVVTRRVMALPAYLANEYYELFDQIGYVYWTNGLLGSLMPYPFDYDPPKLIGYLAMGNRDTWANNGMFGMGFMQAGFVGMLLYGLLYGFWLYLIDCIAMGRVRVEVAVSMVIIPTMGVATDTDLLTGLLTHGGIPATLMLWLWAGTVSERTRVRDQDMSLTANAFRSN
jgi:hypothetical protein